LPIPYRQVENAWLGGVGTGVNLVNNKYQKCWNFHTA